MMTRYLAWFSCGDASAVATKLTLAQYGAENVTVAYTDTGSEHEDNKRFLLDCEKWFGVPILRLKSDEYEDVDDVIERRRFLNGPHGAPCTIELKKKVRWKIEADYDWQVFGYTADSKDAARAVRFRQQNPDVRLLTPLIERGLTKDDCHAVVAAAGIELPEMYKLGYTNNNCIGCVKGKMGYWNKIRVDFPETFQIRSRQERDLDHAMIHDADGPVFLDALDPERGDYGSEPDIECSLLCAITNDEIDGGEAA